MERKGFSADDFARVHPAGSLGRKLTLQVEDLMHSGAAVPRVSLDTSMREVLLEMTSKRLGLTGVFDDKELLVGIVTTEISAGCSSARAICSISRCAR